MQRKLGVTFELLSIEFLSLFKFCFLELAFLRRLRGFIVLRRLDVARRDFRGFETGIPGFGHLKTPDGNQQSEQ